MHFQRVGMLGSDSTQLAKWAAEGAAENCDVRHTLRARDMSVSPESDETRRIKVAPRM